MKRLLVAHQVIEDDSKVMRITSCWDLSVPPGRATIVVKPAAVDVRTGRARKEDSLIRT